jgi:hypothetical protein
VSVRNEMRRSAETVGEVSKSQSIILRRSTDIASIGDTLRRMNCASLEEDESPFEELLLRLATCGK